MAIFRNFYIKNWFFFSRILAKNDNFSKEIAKIDDLFLEFSPGIFSGISSRIFFLNFFPEFFLEFFQNFFWEVLLRKNASIEMEKKLGQNIYQCQMVSSGVVSNGVEWVSWHWKVYYLVINRRTYKKSETFLVLKVQQKPSSVFTIWKNWEQFSKISPCHMQSQAMSLHCCKILKVKNKVWRFLLYV